MERGPLPSALEVRRHELHRIRWLAPVLLATATLIVTVSAYLSELPAWAWNLLAIPILGLPTAAVSTAAEIAIVPRVVRRFPHVAPVPVMVGVRWLSALTIVTALLVIIGPLLVGAGVWWAWFPEWLPRIGASIGLIGVISLAVYDRVYFQLQASFVELERRRALERFLPREAVERVLAGDKLLIGGERRVVTILFADLRESTLIAERMSGPDVMLFLNCYVGAMAKAIFEHGGMLDKYLGDGLMAVFGVLPDASDGAVAAARAAIAIRSRLAELNRERASGGEEPIRHGVGIHTGEVVLGAVGIAERSDYTAVGDTVNTASRLEGLAKQYAIDTVVSEDTARRLTPEEFTLRSLGTAELRGRQARLAVYHLM